MSAYPIIPLAEVADVGAGNSAPQKKELFEDGLYPFIRTSDVGKIRFGQIHTASDLLNEKGVKKLRLVPKGSILMPKSGASTFLNHRVEMAVDAYVSSHLATISAKPEIAVPRYLLYYLWTVHAQDMIQDHKYPSLTLGLIKSIEIPLPPLEEQKRIVAVLDQAFAALDRARADAEANLADAEVLFPNILAQAFKPEASWPICSISNLIEQSIIDRPIDGNHGETHPKKADFVESGVPFIMASDLTDGVVDQENCYFLTRKQADRLRKGFAKDGDVLLSHKGTIGRAALLNTELDYVMLTPQVTYYRVIDPTRLDRLFLFYCLRSAAFQKQMNEIAGLGATRAYIGITRQHDLMLPLPGLDEQRCLVRQFVDAEEKTSLLHGRYRDTLRDIDDLRQSILQKAFSGELN